MFYIILGQFIVLCGSYKVNRIMLLGSCSRQNFELQICLKVSKSYHVQRGPNFRLDSKQTLCLRVLCCHITPVTAEYQIYNRFIQYTACFTAGINAVSVIQIKFVWVKSKHVLSTQIWHPAKHPGSHILINKLRVAISPTVQSLA